MTAYNPITKQFIDGQILTKPDLDQAILDAEATARAQALASLPIASASQAGIVKQGINISIDPTDGTISAVGGGGGGASLGSALPLGAAATPVPGSSIYASHEDHQHGHDATREAMVNKGVASGYAGLDGAGKVPIAQLPLATSSTAGMVPASGGGTTTFYRSDGVFAVPSGSGGGAPYVEATYTASGAIDPAVTCAIVNSSGPVTMTIALGAAGHAIDVVRAGAGTVTVQVAIKGAVVTIPMDGDVSVLNETLSLKMNQAASTYYAL